MRNLQDIKDFVSQETTRRLKKTDGLIIQDVKNDIIKELSAEDKKIIKAELKDASDDFIVEELLNMFILKAYRGKDNFSDKYIAYSVKKLRGVCKHAINKACEDCIDEPGDFVPDIGLFMKKAKDTDFGVRSVFGASLNEQED